jgi:hypothetical protein
MYRIVSAGKGMIAFGTFARRAGMRVLAFALIAFAPFKGAAPPRLLSST